jgi:hypothetical protein
VGHLNMLAASAKVRLFVKRRQSHCHRSDRKGSGAQPRAYASWVQGIKPRSTCPAHRPFRVTSLCHSLLPLLVRFRRCCNVIVSNTRGVCRLIIPKLHNNFRQTPYHNARQEALPVPIRIRGSMQFCRSSHRRPMSTLSSRILWSGAFSFYYSTF